MSGSRSHGCVRTACARRRPRGARARRRFHLAPARSSRSRTTAPSAPEPASTFTATRASGPARASASGASSPPTSALTSPRGDARRRGRPHRLRPGIADSERPIRLQNLVTAPVVIGERAILAAGATVLRGVVVAPAPASSCAASSPATCSRRHRRRRPRPARPRLSERPHAWQSRRRPAYDRAGAGAGPAVGDEEQVHAEDHRVGRRGLRARGRDPAGPRRPRRDRPGARPGARAGHGGRGVDVMGARRRHAVPPGPLPPARAAARSSTRAPRRPRGARGRGRLPVRPARAGCRRRSPTARRARATSASPRYTARRPVIEWVLARAAQSEPGVEIRRGVAVEGLDRAAVRRHAARHRRAHRPRRASCSATSSSTRWAAARRCRACLEAVGARPPIEQAEDSGFIYYTRFFRWRDGQRPESARRRSRRCGSFSVLTLPGDNDTWSVTLYVVGRRPAAQGAAPRGELDAVVARLPAHAHWPTPSRSPTSWRWAASSTATGGSSRRASPSRPAWWRVGDAWACTNPSLGRGITLGLMHARRLRDFVRDHLEHRVELAEVWDRSPRSS